MLIVTDSALEHLYDAISQADVRPAAELCFRFVAQDDETLTLVLQTPAAGDRTFEHNGAVVLALPEQLADYFSQRTLDVDNDGQLILLSGLSH